MNPDPNADELAHSVLEHPETPSAPAPAGPLSLGRALTAAGWLGVLALGIGLYRGTLTRLLFDDFELATGFRTMGWIAHARSLYESWSGRIPMNIGAGPLASLGATGAMICGPALLVWWWSAITAIIGKALRFRNVVTTRTQRMLIAAIATAALLLGTPSQFQSTRWISGTLVYGVPVALLLTALALALEPERGATNRTSILTGLRWLVITFCLVLSSAGNETQALGVPIVCFIIALTFWRTATSRWRFAVAFLASAFGSAILLLSPGAHLRASKLGASHAIGDLFSAVSSGIIVYVASLAVYAPLAIATFFALGRLVGLRTIGNKHRNAPSSEDPTRAVRRISILAFIVSSGAIISLPAYTMNKPAPLRSYLSAWVALAVLTVLCGWRSAERFPDSRSNASLALVTRWTTGIIGTIASIAFLTSAASALPSERDQAKTWSCIDRSIREQGGDVVVDAPESVGGIAFLRRNATRHSNEVTADYYGVSSIRSAKGAACGSPKA